ncbi:MAG: tetratricopeptide repeat protein [Bacteroidota bacterium]
MKKLILLFLILTFGSSLQAQIPGEAEYLKSEEYLAARDYENWYEQLKLAAAKSHPAATGRMGDAYYFGKPETKLKQSFDEALAWYKKAAELKDKDATYLVGNMYRDGKITGKTYTDAVEYYKTIVPKGNYDAAQLIAEAYITGEGVTQNYATAMEWLKKGEAVKHAGCIYDMGYMYRNGAGVTKDINKAMGYYETACSLGDKLACENLGELYYQGTEITGSVELCRKWYEMGSNLGSSKSSFYLSVLYTAKVLEGGKIVAAAYAKLAREQGLDDESYKWLAEKINAME